MKLFIIALFALSTVISVQAAEPEVLKSQLIHESELISIQLQNNKSCVELFENKISDLDKKGSGLTLLAAPVLGVGSAVAVGSVEVIYFLTVGTQMASLMTPVGLAVFGASAGYILTEKGIKKVKKIKLTRLIRLINEADQYLADGTKGKLISQVFKRIQKKNPEATLSDVSAEISKGNQDLSLCEGKISVSRIERNLPNY